MATCSSILAWKIPQTEKPWGIVHGVAKELDTAECVPKYMCTCTHTHTYSVFQGMVPHRWLSTDLHCWLDRHSAVAIAKLSLGKGIPPNWNWAHVAGFMSSLHLWHHGCSIWKLTVTSLSHSGEAKWRDQFAKLFSTSHKSLNTLFLGRFSF